MKTILMVILSISLGSIYSCKQSSQAMSTSEVLPDTDSKENAGKLDESGKTYDLIVSFISKGEGIDRVLKPEIDKIIENFNTTNKTDIQPEILHWGREGEIDYNFIFKNLSTSKKKEFITTIEEVVGSSDMVHITFNQKSVHKR